MVSEELLRYANEISMELDKAIYTHGRLHSLMTFYIDYEHTLRNGSGNIEIDKNNFLNILSLIKCNRDTFSKLLDDLKRLNDELQNKLDEIK